MSSKSPEAAQSDAIAASSSARLSSTVSLLDGTEGFSQLRVLGVPTTASTVFDITASSSATKTATNSMYNTLVHSTGATTFTTTGYVRVKITDSAGNLVDGDHYIRLGSLT